MWAAGVTEGLMWRATNADGSLTYGFLTSLIAVKPYLRDRASSAACSCCRGMVVMAWNLWHTAEPRAPVSIEPCSYRSRMRFPSRSPHQVPAPLPATGLRRPPWHSGYKHLETIEKNAGLLAS